MLSFFTAVRLKLLEKKKASKACFLCAFLLSECLFFFFTAGRAAVKLLEKKKAKLEDTRKAFAKNKVRLKNKKADLMNLKDSYKTK